MAQKITLPDIPDLAPEPPPRGPVVWAKLHLFSTPSSIVLTIFFALVAWFAIRGMSRFILSDDRKWQAVTTNFRLLGVQAYPDEHLWRIWVSVGIVAVLLGFSLAFWRVATKIQPRKLFRSIQYVGAAIAALVLIAPVSIKAQVIGVIIGAVLLGVPVLLARAMGDRAKTNSIPSLLVPVALGAIVLTILWLIRVPVPEVGGGIGDKVFERIARSTLGPWTLLYLSSIVAYFVAVFIRDRVPGARTRPIIVSLWVLSFPVIVLHLTRATSFDNIGAETVAKPDGGLGIAEYLLIGLAFAVIGGAFIWFVANPKLGELGRGLAGFSLVVAVIPWLFSAPMILRILLLALAMFALAGPTFAGGERRATMRYVAVWMAAVVVIVYLLLLAVGETTVATPNETPFGGYFLTWILAIVGIALSFPIGVVMALARTSTMPIFRLLATAYIEVVRGVPLITWLLVSVIIFPFLFPVDVSFVGPAKVILFIAFFSGAYLAENVRGGLQSIGKGQNEAADALGMTTLQRTVFITLPQALQAVIPALVGQVIALFKDTSLVAIVGLFDLLQIGRSVIPSQSGAGRASFNFLQTQREGLIAIAIMYWIFTFIFSRVSQRMEKKLGLGER